MFLMEYTPNTPIISNVAQLNFRDFVQYSKSPALSYLVSPFYDDALNTVLQLAVTVLTYRKPTCQKEVLVIVFSMSIKTVFAKKKPPWELRARASTSSRAAAP